MGPQKPWISVVARTLLGFPLAAVLAALGMALASALAVFFGVAALPNILTMLMVGAGVGAGIGAGIILLRVDSIPAWPILLGAGLALSAVSFGGAWVGFQIGGYISAIEDARCVGVCPYLFKPRTYIALGAALAPNIIALLFNIGYEGIFGRFARAARQPRGDGTLGPSNETGSGNDGARAAGKSS